MDYIFKESALKDSFTKETIYKECTWRGTRDTLLLIDTPGFLNGDISDARSLDNMILRLSEI